MYECSRPDARRNLLFCLYCLARTSQKQNGMLFGPEWIRNAKCIRVKKKWNDQKELLILNSLKTHFHMVAGQEMLVARTSPSLKTQTGTQDTNCNRHTCLPKSQFPEKCIRLSASTECYSRKEEGENPNNKNHY